MALRVPNGAASLGGPDAARGSRRRALGPRRGHGRDSDPARRTGRAGPRQRRRARHLRFDVPAPLLALGPGKTFTIVLERPRSDASTAPVAQWLRQRAARRPHRPSPTSPTAPASTSLTRKAPASSSTSARPWAPAPRGATSTATACSTSSSSVAAAAPSARPSPTGFGSAANTATSPTSPRPPASPLATRAWARCSPT